MDEVPFKNIYFLFELSVILIANILQYIVAETN